MAVDSANETVIGRFAKIARKFADRPAIAASQTLTYQKLDDLSGRFASVLGALVPGAADLVGISIPNMGLAIAAMLGVLKTGRKYVFIDAHTAPARKKSFTRAIDLELLAADSDSTLGFDGRVIFLPAAFAEASTPSSYAMLAPADACCLVQTSGTTGEPLAVEISSAALLHKIDNYTRLAEITEEDRFTLLTSPAQFAAHTAIYGALLNGACLHPFDVRANGFSKMAAWMEESRLTIYQSPPSLFRAFMQHLEAARRFPKVKLVRLGGEIALASDFELFKRHFPRPAKFANTLGVTEAGGNVAFHLLDHDSILDGSVVPVGAMAAGVEISLVSDSGGEITQAEPGEIIVRGKFLASGYYRNPDLTSRRFQSLPDGTCELSTGDLGYLDATGHLVHAGRRDSQVKIRGYRVHLGAVETLLASIPGVKSAHVLLHSPDANHGELVAFVACGTVAADPDRIRQRLMELMPMPVLPRIFLLEELPLSSGGKVDRRRLLHLLESPRIESRSASARNDLEQRISSIWSSVLGHRDIGVYEDFFALGGDSLKALQVIAELGSQLKRTFSARLLLDRRTIAELAEYLTGKQKPARGDKAERAVALRASRPGMETPLFICPGGWGHEGELLVFAAMLPFLPPELPIYGLRQSFMSKLGIPARNLEILARNFLREIRTVQPQGPYRLVGECVASLTVLEIVAQLRRAGGQVETIILLDPRRSESPTSATPATPAAEKARRYYHMLSTAKISHCSEAVHVIGVEEPRAVRDRLAAWGIFDLARLDVLRVPGDHASYIREHGATVAREINRLIAKPSYSGVAALS